MLKAFNKRLFNLPKCLFSSYSSTFSDIFNFSPIFYLVNIMSQKQKWFYAVGVGRVPGIYNTWAETEAQTKGILNAKYRKFTTYEAAQAFVDTYASPTRSSPSMSPVKNPTTPPSTPPQGTRTTRAATSTVEKSIQTVKTLFSKSSQPHGSQLQSSSNSLLEFENRLQVLEDNFLTFATEKAQELQRLRQDLHSLRSQASNAVPFQNQPSTSGTSYHAAMHSNNDFPNLPSTSTASSGSESKNINLINTLLRLKNRSLEQELERPTKRTKLLEDEPEPRNGASNTQFKFAFDGDGYCIVYTDGACLNNGQRNAKAGIGVWFGQGHPLNASEPLMDCLPTNNNAEIQAAAYALVICKETGLKKICIHTDSEFVINCVTKWMNNWIKKGWKKADGQAVKNKEQLEKLNDAREGLDVKWIHVAGHSNIEGNEQADRLANEGAARFPNNPILSKEENEVLQARYKINVLEKKIKDHQSYIQRECMKIKNDLKKFESDKKKVDYDFYKFSNIRRPSVDLQNLKHAELLSLLDKLKL